MEISDALLCLFTAQVRERDGSYVIEVPETELSMGDLRNGEMYRVALLASEARTGDADVGADRDLPEPPVAEGDVRDVEIEDLGAQGDGIARVERGYIVFVPGTGIGDEVTIEVTSVTDNYAFGEVIEDGVAEDGEAEAESGDGDRDPWSGA